MNNLPLKFLSMSNKSGVLIDKGLYLNGCELVVFSVPVDQNQYFSIASKNMPRF